MPFISQLVLLTCLLAIARAVVQALTIDGLRGPSLLDWCLLPITALAAAAALLALRRAMADSVETSNPRGTANRVWLIVSLAALFVWPDGLDAERHPLMAWMTLGAWGGLLLHFATGNRQRSSMAVTRWLLFVLLLVGLVSAVQYFRAIQQHVGSVDFFYFLCYARDQSFAPDNVSPKAYAYFPGVYAFWRSVWRSGAESLSTFQAAHLTVVALYGLLAGAITLRATRSRLAAGWTVVFVWVLASRFQGFTGVTEPLATLPFLAAVAYWRGRSLHGTRGVLRAIALGIGFGVAVYCKQQAGLLALGALALVMDYPCREPQRRPAVLRLALVPLIATAVLLSGILAEGQGWFPLQEGLRTASQYRQQGSFWSNLYAQIRHDESTALLVFQTMLWWIFALLVALVRSGSLSSRLRLVSLLMISGLATLIQFRARPYAHYALLGIACLVPAAVILARPWLRRIAHNSTQKPLTAWVLAWIALFPLFYTGANPQNLHVWHVTPPDLSSLRLWQERPDVARDLRAVRELLPSEEIRVCVLPAYRGEVYFVTGARAARSLGYGFHLPPADKFPFDDVEYLLVIKSAVDDHPDRQSEHEPLIQDILRASSEFGFRSLLDLPTMTVYRR